MDTVQVKKIVAVCFLEAVKMSLDHIGTHRMSIANEQTAGSAELPKLYGEVRRLRDYLQRCASAYQDVVELELPEDDRSLLVACCRRYVDAIDMRLAGPEISDSRERQFLLKKQQVIADWTVELSAKPLVEFPMPRVSDVLGDGARGLKARIQQKLFALNEQSLISRGTMKPVAGGGSFGGSAAGRTLGTVPVINLVDSKIDGVSDEDDDIYGNPSFGAPAVLNEHAKLPLVDPNALQDPRLRALVAMDLRSLELVETGGDYRLVTVLLATILEAAVLDYAIPRRKELKLVGGPDAWHPQKILFQVLGDTASPSHRSQAYNLFYSRKLLSPAQQIVAPMVATTASVRTLREFVEKMLHQLGFAGNARSMTVDSGDAGN